MVGCDVAALAEKLRAEATDGKAAPVVRRRALRQLADLVAATLHIREIAIRNGAVDNGI